MSRRVLLRQFSSFGVIGTAAFLVDSALLYLGLGLFGLGFYLARFLSWFGGNGFGNRTTGSMRCTTPALRDIWPALD